MQIKLDTINTTYKKKKQKQQNVSCRYQFKDIQKDELSHFFCPIFVATQFTKILFWRLIGWGLEKTTQLGRGLEVWRQMAWTSRMFFQGLT